MSEPNDDPDGGEDGETYQCQECGYTGSDFIEEENPDERTWGPLGDYFLICPECNALQM
jgi:hypothetical protein